MQVILKEHEIKQAIMTFVGNQGVSMAGKKVDVALIAGRGANGMSATIDINDNGENEMVVEIKDENDKTEDEIAEADENSDATKQMDLFGGG